MNNLNIKTVGEVLSERQRINVDNNKINGDINNNVSNAENFTIEEILKLFSKRFTDDKVKKDWIAKSLADKLCDVKSINYYRYIAGKYPEHLLFECLSLAMDAKQSGHVKTTVAKYFVGILKRKVKKKSVEK